MAPRPQCETCARRHERVDVRAGAAGHPQYSGQGSDRVVAWISGCFPPFPGRELHTTATFTPASVGSAVLTLPILSGFAVAAFIVGTAAAYQRAPTRSRCPRCGRRTRGVVPGPWPAAASRWLIWRWCPACSWEGPGRTGPERSPGRPAAHESGFRWGADRVGRNLGFEWRAPDLDVEDTLPRLPAHPSGFHWGEPHLDDEVRPVAATRVPPAHPSGFRWNPVSRAPVFEWKRTRRGSARRQRPPPGFTWKKPA